jgi:hypothetical protein
MHSKNPIPHPEHRLASSLNKMMCAQAGRSGVPTLPFFGQLIIFAGHPPDHGCLADFLSISHSKHIFDVKYL